MDKDFYRGRPFIFACALAAMAIFTLLGVAFACHILWTIAEWRRLQSWVETPAIIEDVRMESGRVRHRRTAKVVARYRYQFGDRQFTGDRVAVVTISDAVGSFQKRAYRELMQHKNERKPFRCFVNPEQPAEAVLYRDLRWELILLEAIFAVAFTAVGGTKLVSIWRVRPWNH